MENIRSGDYPFTRPLLLISKQEPKGAAKKFFDFILSEEGQKIVEKHRFVKVK
jgi:phosphate transport system substrate-binding protein